jgi:glucose-1-phosphate cytidylyltransferase
MPTPEPPEVPIFVLCGGLGSRLGEAGSSRPKPMLDIGEKPMLLHIMGWYARFGFRRFVLCTGHRSEVISGYFANFAAHNSDFTVDLADRRITYHQEEGVPPWVVTLAFTGAAAMTGARIARAAARYLGAAAHFGVTYGDGLTDADLGDEYRFHLAHTRLGTMLGVHPPSQFGRMALHEDGSASFAEKASHTSELVNGGFFFFRRGVLDYLSAADSCVLEGEPLQRLTAEGQLTAYRHGGFWSCVDTLRDREVVQGLWEAGAAPWKG